MHDGHDSAYGGIYSCQDYCYLCDYSKANTCSLDIPICCFRYAWCLTIITTSMTTLRYSQTAHH